jgi:hypothetical protein
MWLNNLPARLRRASTGMCHIALAQLRGPESQPSQKIWNQEPLPLPFRLPGLQR